MGQTSEADYRKLDDPQLFEERRHVRDKLERLPECHADRKRLAAIYAAMTEEFDRRARIAWTCQS